MKNVEQGNMLECNCEESEQAAELVTVNADTLNAVMRALSDEPAAKKGKVVNKQIHITPQGDLLSTISTIEGVEGSIVLSGSIGPIPLKLQMSLSVEKRAATVTLKVDEPMPFEHTWKFELAPSGVTLAPDSTVASAATGVGLNWWCVFKCGGVGILGILVRCLPALAGGIPGYVECVTSKAGQGAAGIAVCIATKCV
ncbi:MAG: hypothetical protein ACYTEL_18675 [Planctomycetota bacterium]|jgi:hypothetical protein